MAGTCANLGVLIFSLLIGGLVTTIGYTPFFIGLAACGSDRPPWWCGRVISETGMTQHTDTKSDPAGLQSRSLDPAGGR